ncbi:MAG: hypothetical protein R6U84_10080 [Candidatus Cloacimonadales bacterium]
MKNISIYKIISVLAALTLVFILILGQRFSNDPKQETKECLRNMNEIYDAIELYMSERDESFSGDVSDLYRSGYLKKSTYICPSGKPDDKYFLKGDIETGEIQVICPHVAELPDHVLPESLKN